MIASLTWVILERSDTSDDPSPSLLASSSHYSDSVTVSTTSSWYSSSVTDAWSASELDDALSSCSELELDSEESEDEEEEEDCCCSS